MAARGWVEVGIGDGYLMGVRFPFRVMKVSWDWIEVVVVSYANV